MPAYEFNLNVDPGGMPPVIHLAQYDTGRTYYAKLKQGGDYYYLGLGVTAKIKGRNARGVCWELPCEIDSVLTYKVQFTPEGAATDQFGIMPVQMELTDSQGSISTLLMVWDIQRAGYTSEEAVTSPEFETALEAAVAAAIAQQGLGFTEEFKQALLACLNNVAWATPDGQSLVDDLEDALYPEVHLTSITADYEQDRPILDTDSLDLVRLDLVVTANYSDGTSETLADDAYTLTGTLTVGTSTITVGYQGKTDTIEVIVTGSVLPAGYTLKEYIERPATASTDISPASTGFMPNGTDDLVVEIGCMATATPPSSSGGYFIGCRQNADQNSVGFGVYAPQNLHSIGAFDGSSCMIEPEGAGNSIEDKKYDLTVTKTTTSLTVTDGDHTNTVTRTPRSMATDIYLFGFESTGYTQHVPMIGRIYYLTITEGGVVKVNMVPCVRDSDSAAGFWDTVAETFVTHTDFIAG